MALETNHHIDKLVDAEIAECLNLDSLKSFFLFAGAGSGKTSSLVKALIHVDKNFGQRLNLNGQKVAVITYTIAARDEILSRIEYNNLFIVSTIHSFAWELIRPYTQDIKKRIQSKIEESLVDLEDKQSRARGVNKSSIDRARKIESKKRRLSNLVNVNKFSYNPVGENKSKDSLNHSEVLDLVSYFLSEKSLMQSILVRKMPILLIDESQDTNKHLIDALFLVEKKYRTQFCLGLIGDMMQRIYLDGKANLGEEVILEDWKTPIKRLNHRCPSRIVTLINKIRKLGDGQEQQARTDADEGTVRLFVIGKSTKPKSELEQIVSSKMASITKDELWTSKSSAVQKLTLEHHMVASRMGFKDLFDPLYGETNLKTGLIDGSDSNLTFLRNLILPLYQALKDKDKFAVARICKKNSPILSLSQISSSEKKIEQLQRVNKIVENLFTLWNEGKDPSLISILKNLHNSKLFDLPETLSIIASRSMEESKLINESEAEGTEETNSIIDAWDIALNAPFSQIVKYDNYISGNANFATHQGVKGKEFPRVMVVIDDEESRGFLFSYEKLFGVRDLSAADLKNISEGNDNGFSRPLRLFYVTCSRAEESLAIVAYTENPELLISNVIDNEWFTESEIEIVD